jgi:hypothetical protein
VQSRLVSETRVKVVRSKKPSDLPVESKETRKTFSAQDGTLPENNYRSLAERVAGHRLYQRGVFLPFLKEAFPHLKHMWCVDRYFPYSIHGSLYIDEPVKEFQVAESQKKRAVLEKFGLRLIVLGPMVTYQQAMEQLAEFAPCHGRSIQQ